MPSAINVAGEVASAAASLGGMALVYLGAVTGSFSGFEPQERKTVLPQHQRRVWFAFIGIVLSLISVALSLLGKWLAVECMAASAIVILIVALAWVLATALLTVLEVK